MCPPSAKAAPFATPSAQLPLLLHLAFLTASFGVLVPFFASRRDSLSCDASCFGRYSSARSAAGLVGSLLVTRLSDLLGRRAVLCLGLAGALAGLLLSASLPHAVSTLYVAMLPGALLQQNFSVAKALVSDLAALGLCDRPKLIGRMGMVVGLAFMLGPALGGSVIPTFEAGLNVAIAMVLLSAACLLFVTVPPPAPSSTPAPSNPLASFFNLPAARSPGALTVMCMRVLMSLAFHVFMTVWSPSLKERFDFQPKDHGERRPSEATSVRRAGAWVRAKVWAKSEGLGPSECLGEE
jgi:MFS family permease